MKKFQHKMNTQMSDNIEHGKIPDEIVGMVGKTPILHMHGESIIVAKKKGRFNVLQQAPTPSVAPNATTESTSSSVLSSQSDIERNMELNQHTWSDISQLSDPSAFMEAIGGEVEEKTTTTPAMPLITNLASLFQPPQPRQQQRQPQPQPNLASLFQPPPQPKYHQQRQQDVIVKNMSSSSSSFRNNDDVPIRVVYTEQDSLSQGSNIKQHSSLLPQTKTTFDSSSSFIADDDDLSVVSSDSDDGCGLSNILYCLDQMKFEVTNSDRAMKKLRKELKSLKQANTNLQKRNANLQTMYNEQVTLREAAEAKLKRETSIVQPGLGTISLPVRSNIVDHSNNNCSEISTTKRSNNRFIRLATTAPKKLSSSTNKKVDENVIAKRVIGGVQQLGVSTLSKQKNGLSNINKSKEGKVNGVTGMNSSLMPNGGCCSHSVSSVTVISQEDFVSAAKKMLNKKQRRRKKNTSNNKHTMVHKKVSSQYNNEQEKEENWDFFSVNSFMTQETQSIHSSDFSSCDDVVSSEEDDVLSALSVSTPSNQSLSSQPGRRIKTKQHHQSKNINKKKSSRFRLLGPTLDSTIIINNTNATRSHHHHNILDTHSKPGNAKLK